MEENKNPDMNGKELTEENLEQVTGGITLPLGLATGSDGAATAANAANSSPASSWVVPAGIVSGAAIMIGGAWQFIDHQRPGQASSQAAPTPETVPETPSTPGLTPQPKPMPNSM